MTKSLRIFTIETEPFFENAYVVAAAQGSEAVVVDPSFDVEPILDCLRENQLDLVAIWNTHGHLDHIAGLAHYASRRRLQGLPPARILVPSEAVSAVARWVDACEELEKIRYSIEVVPASPGDRITLRNDLELTVLPGRHRVPAVGYLFSEVKHKLLEEFGGRPGHEIAELKAKGVAVTRREEVPLLAYTGDCGEAIFDAAPEILRAKVLLIECSFLFPEDVSRAREYAHIHLDDILARADRFENEALVLTHFSQRYRAEEIRQALAAIPVPLAARVVPFLPPL